MKQISVNFGVIKDAIFTFSAKEMIAEHKNNARVLNEFYNSIKENPALKLQYLIYKNLENGQCAKERLAERYINQNLKLIESQKWEDILKVNKELRRKALGEQHIEALPGKNDLYEAINLLIKSVTYRKFTDIDASQQAYDLVMEHLLKPKVENVPADVLKEETEYPKFLSWKFVTNLAVNKFNERYVHLSEGEKKLVKTLLMPFDNKLNYYLDLRKENLDQVSNLLSSTNEESAKSALQTFKDKMQTMAENIHPLEIDEAIINLEELKISLQDLNAAE